MNARTARDDYDVLWRFCVSAVQPWDVSEKSMAAIRRAIMEALSEVDRLRGLVSPAGQAVINAASALVDVKGWGDGEHEARLIDLRAVVAALRAEGER